MVRTDELKTIFNNLDLYDLAATIKSRVTDSVNILVLCDNQKDADEYLKMSNLNPNVKISKNPKAVILLDEKGNNILTHYVYNINEINICDKLRGLRYGKVLFF